MGALVYLELHHHIFYFKIENKWIVIVYNMQFHTVTAANAIALLTAVIYSAAL